MDEELAKTNDIDWVKSRGRWKVTKNNISIICNKEFSNYYKNLIEKELDYKINLPSLGAHITIISKSSNGLCSTNKFKNYDNQPVDFWFDRNIKIGGGNTVNYKVFWTKAKINEDFVRKIKDILWARESDDFWGFHLTFGNTKKKNYERIKTRTKQRSI